MAKKLPNPTDIYVGSRVRSHRLILGMSQEKLGDALGITFSKYRNTRKGPIELAPAASTPDPKWVVAIGDCALDGGIFAGSYACVGGVSQVVPVDLHIRGCPPSPSDLLRGLIALLGS